MRLDLDGLKTSIEQALADHLPQHSDIAPELVEAMRYAVLGGGKRLRPMFACSACTALGGNLSDVLPAACAVEYVHTYSLVHDDLPAMDDDALRHGRAATHIAHGEANAILAGDALLTLAFEILSELPDAGPACVRALARGAGWAGMVGGQTLDMALPALDTVDQARLEALHNAKTGALIGAALSIGAHIAGASDSEHRHLAAYAQSLGLAFQVKDDVLDCTATTEQLGKPAGSDEAASKHTFVSLMGIQAAQGYAAALLDEALASLRHLDMQHDGLEQLAHRAVHRTH